MTNNREDLRERYFKSAELILQNIRVGKAAAYLTIGDPLLYSTYIYLVNALLELAPELIVETICICPVPEDMDELREVIIKNDTVIVMKVAKKLPMVIALLEEMGILQNAIFGSHVGLEGERLIMVERSLLYYQRKKV